MGPHLCERGGQPHASSKGVVGGNRGGKRCDGQRGAEWRVLRRVERWLGRVLAVLALEPLQEPLHDVQALAAAGVEVLS